MSFSEDMKEVWIQDAQVKLDKENLKVKIKTAKRSFKFEHKLWIRLLDIGLICAIIFNITAIFLTNVLVMKNNENVTILEANPDVARLGNYQTNEAVQKEFDVFISVTIFWAIHVIVYIFNRSILFRKWQLFLLTVLVVFLLFTTGMDMFNNWGYFVGKLLFH